jgi:hypothetical protein
VKTSQHGEDGILESIFARLSIERGVCVEFGAWDGKIHSNTYSLISDHGWRGVMIEGDPARYADLCKTFADRSDVTCLDRIVGFDGDERLDAILASTEIAYDFDLLSIDVDGCDYWIFAAMETYRPKVVVIEFNPTIPHRTEFVQARDLRVNHGSSLRAIVNLARRKGYELAAATQVNAIFVKSELFSKLGITDNSIDKLHVDCFFHTYVVQLYDGTVLLDGPNVLIWRDPKVEVKLPQPLAPGDRKFSDALKRKE